MDNINLFFIPHAGGSAMGYMNFKIFLDKRITPFPLELAGRGKRINEKCFCDAKACAQDLFDKNKDLLQSGRYVFFGHSLGTLIAYELTKLICEKGLQGPEHIFFSGRPAPKQKIDSEFQEVSKLNDDDFISKFASVNGLPKEVLNNKQIMNMILPVLRSDVAMAESYKFEDDIFILPCDISVFYGNADKMFSADDTKSWEQCTSGSCNIYSFEGEHFYYNNPENKKKLCELINSILIAQKQIDR